MSQDNSKHRSKDIVKLGNYYDLHTGYHDIFLNHPNRYFVFQAAKPKVLCGLLREGKKDFHPTEYPFYFELHQYPADSGFIQSTFFPVSNRVPWVVDMDDICVPFYGNTYINRNLTRRLRREYHNDPLYKRTILTRLSLYSSSYCKGILFWSMDGIKGALSCFKDFDIYNTPEVREFLQKVILAYPVVKPFIKRVKLNRPRTVLFMARGFEDKGGNIALAAFKKLRKHDPRIRLIYCGPISNKYKKCYADLLEQITYFPEVIHEEALLLLKKSDIFIFPTQFESFGITLIEAMAAGCIPLSYSGKDLEVIKEIIENGRTGVLLRKNEGGIDETKEAQRFFKKIIWLLSDDKKLRGMKRRALEEVTKGKFSFSKRIDLLKRLFNSRNEGAEVNSLDKYKIYPYNADDFNNMLLEYRKHHKVPRRVMV